MSYLSPEHMIKTIKSMIRTFAEDGLFTGGTAQEIMDFIDFKITQERKIEKVIKFPMKEASNGH